MRNIEIKARLSDPQATLDCAMRLCGGGPTETLEQIDTYFNCNSGRLKLREISGSRKHCELIFYRRPDSHGPKASDYQISPVAQADSLKSLLARACGVSVVVSKKRELFMYRNVRIHIDEVAGLGSFLEFEAVMPEGAPDSEGNALLEFLLHEFGIAPHDLLAGSYSDMLRI